MAKVTGPLMSMSASGQVGKGIVFSIWKGNAYVRRYLKPMNPQTAGQGDQRIVVGGAGRVSGKVAVGSDVSNQLITLGVVPSGQSKQSYLVKYIISHLLPTSSSYTSLLAEFTGHTGKLDFIASAVNLGVADFDLAYATVAPFSGGFQVYVLAKALIAIGLTGAPFTTALASWDETELALLEAALVI